MGLAAFLEAKPLYYDVIDYDRMPRIYAAVRHRFTLPKIIHIVGTNGKGSTGRFIATALKEAGFRVGHYTSPHILNFNERVWMDGEDATDAQLETAHALLYGWLEAADAAALSYFEYTTLLAMTLYRDCEWAVLEAGLGGEHDATNVFPKLLSVFTPIDVDHQAFLGESIAEIAATKLRSMGPALLLAEQPHGEVCEIASELAVQRGARCMRIKEILDDADMEEIEACAARNGLPGYMAANMQTAAAALKFLGIESRPEGFAKYPMFGRMSRIGENVTVDVGHNPLAARAIARAMAPRRVVLVYNTYRDKDFATILEILAPIIKRVAIIEVQESRIVPRALLEAALEARGVEYGPFDGVKADEEYLVFGSFSVVEAFMRGYHA